ncbi:MAG: GtrA-like protein [Bacteroidetes bacterium ADurb.Bin174]|nr:MAG: GtrA-like protein [Bacteroidetes bacterium ADurb.Bin174]
MTLKTKIKKKTDNVFIQIIRYFISGGIAAAVDFGLLYLLTEFFGLYYLWSAVISFSVGLLITYIFSITWIFNQRRISNRWIELLIFSIIGVVGLLLTYLFMQYFTEVIKLHYMLSKVLTTIIVFFWNFLTKRFVLFTRKK